MAVVGVEDGFYEGEVAEAECEGLRWEISLAWIRVVMF